MRLQLHLQLLAEVSGASSEVESESYRRHSSNEYLKVAGVLSCKAWMIAEFA
jgi:hypothetical protein